MQSSPSGSYAQSSSAQISSPHPTKVFAPPWMQSVLGYQPPSGYAAVSYPISPPPTPDRLQAKLIPMPHTASPYSTEDKAVMTGIQEYKESSIYGTAIHTNPPVGYNIASANNASSSSDSKVKSQYNHPNSSYERKVDVKRDDDALGLVRAIEALSVKEKKAGIKAAEAVNKITSPKRAAKAAKTSKTTFARTFLELGRKKKASAPDAPSRRPRSSLGDQHRRVELFGYLGGEVPAKVVRRRKPLPSANKDPLCMTLHRSGRTAGAVPSSYPGEIVNPIKNDLMSMWAEGRTLGHSDNNGARMATLSRYKSWNGLDYV